GVRGASRWFGLGSPPPRRGGERDLRDLRPGPVLLRQRAGRGDGRRARRLRVGAATRRARRDEREPRRAGPDRGGPFNPRAARVQRGDGVDPARSFFATSWSAVTGSFALTACETTRIAF